MATSPSCIVQQAARFRSDADENFLPNVCNFRRTKSRDEWTSNSEFSYCQHMIYHSYSNIIAYHFYFIVHTTPAISSRKRRENIMKCSRVKTHNDIDDTHGRGRTTTTRYPEHHSGSFPIIFATILDLEFILRSNENFLSVWRAVKMMRRCPRLERCHSDNNRTFSFRKHVYNLRANVLAHSPVFHLCASSFNLATAAECWWW